MNVLAASAVVAFAMAWAIGAQDVSNALGTSVGSKALSVNQAIVVGAIFEFLGSLMGGAVVTTISKGVIAPSAMTDELELYVLIMFSTLAGAFVWLAFATYFSLPVSTTHSLMGSLIGLGFTHLPLDRVNTSTLGTIVLSWVTSPLIGLVVAYSVFKIIYSRILTRPHPKYEALKQLPYYYGFTFGTLSLFILFKGPTALRLSGDRASLVSLCVAAFTTVAVKYGVVNRHFQQYLAENGAVRQQETELVAVKKASSPGKPSAAASPTAKPTPKKPAQPHTVGAKADIEALVKDDKVAHAEQLFSTLMVMTACVVAFAHGSNDVSNSIGPFAAIVEIYTYGDAGSALHERPVPSWVLVAGGAGIVVGLATYGYKVMATVGEKITKLTFTRGFAAQIATAFTVLSATLVGLSVSTTHCLIGAVAGVGLVESSDKLNKAMLKKIALSWIITMPASAFFSLVLFWLVSALDAWL